MKLSLKEFAMQHYNLVEGPSTEPTADAAPLQQEAPKSFAQIANAEGKIYSYEGDGPLTVGAVLFDGEEGSELLAAPGNILLEDGSTIVVGENGVVEELIEAGAEDAPAEEEALQAPTVPTAVKETVTTETTFSDESETEFAGNNLEAILFAVNEILTPVLDRLTILEGGTVSELSAAKIKLAKAEQQVAKLSKMPAAKPHQVMQEPAQKQFNNKRGSIHQRLHSKK